MKRIAVYAALLCAGLILFGATHIQATASRGYEAIGGEAAFIFLPLLYAAVRNSAKAWREEMRPPADGGESQ